MRRRKLPPIHRQPRTERVTILLSKSELEVLERYLCRHPHYSRSAFIRRCVMERIVGEAVRHRPSLFADYDDGDRDETDQL